MPVRAANLDCATLLALPGCVEALHPKRTDGTPQLVATPNVESVVDLGEEIVIDGLIGSLIPNSSVPMVAWIRES